MRRRIEVDAGGTLQDDLSRWLGIFNKGTGMFTYRWRLSVKMTSFCVTARSLWHGTRITIEDERTLLADQTFSHEGEDALAPKSVSVSTQLGRLDVTVGSIGWWTTACQARLDGEEVFRSHPKDFRIPASLQGFFDGVAELNAKSETPEAKARAKESAISFKRRWPSLAVDILLGAIFFIVARYTDLPTAAITVAAITLTLIILQPFLKKVDLLGGFAVFGAAMALISAGLSLAYQDDFFVKLRGTIIGAIGAAAFLVDGLFGGRYLGKRMQGYMETAWPIDPKRGAFALASVALILASVDLAAAFTLPNEFWLVYNAALDSLIAIPLTLAALWWAKTPRPVT
jgi:intracellular septation protein A